MTECRRDVFLAEGVSCGKALKEEYTSEKLKKARVCGTPKLKRMSHEGCKLSATMVVKMTVVKDAPVTVYSYQVL